MVNAKRILVETQNTFANAQKREQWLRTLVSSGATPRLDYLDAQAKVIQSQADITKAEDGITNAADKVSSLEKDIAAQTQEIRQAELVYQSAQGQLARLQPERQSEIITQLNKRREE